jgi:hypothetical protein
MKSILIFLAAIFIVWVNALAADYQYHPTRNLHLTGGFDPDDPSNPPLPCVDGGGIVPGNPRETKYDSMLVTDSKSLYRAFNVDAALSARYLFISATDTFHLSDESALNEDSLSWVLRASQTYEADTLTNPTLNSEAKKLLPTPQNPSSDAFYKRCRHSGPCSTQCRVAGQMPQAQAVGCYISIIVSLGHTRQSAVQPHRHRVERHRSSPAAGQLL